MRNLICLSLAAVIAATGLYLVNDSAEQASARETTGAAAAQEAPESPLELFMRKKLSASNQILEGLVIDDMEKVGAGADVLLEMSTAAKWRASNDMLYRQHSRSFRESVEELQAKAKKGTVDGAALAWMDVTLNCIQCHEWVRNVLIADVSPPFGSEQDTQ